MGVRALTNWTYDAADPIITKTSAGAVTTFILGDAGNRKRVQAPDGVNTHTWERGNRLREIALPDDARSATLGCFRGAIQIITQSFRSN